MDASSSALIEGLRAAVEAKVKDLSGQFDPSPRSLVGSGGYSTVYIATWRSPECEEPVKVCYKELRPPVSNMREAVERTRKTVKYLTREMGVWSRLDHPHILKFLGFAVEGDGCDVKGILVSPWCPNGSVLEYLEKNPHAERIDLARGIAKGLDYLHHLTPAVIHGDLKPANVLVSDDHNAILCDFGLSRFSSELTTGQTSSAAAFTIRFTPPEVILDEERKSIESDVYSFACTCIPILFGKQPFSGLNDIQIVARIPKEVPWNWDLKDPLQCTLSDCCSVVTENRPSIRKVLQTAAFVGSSLPPEVAHELNMSNVVMPQLFSTLQVPNVNARRIPIPENGVIAAIHVTAFQGAIDTLLSVARSGNPGDVLTSMKAVEVAVDAITDDVRAFELSSPRDISSETIPSWYLRERVHAALRNLVSAAQQHASGFGLSPISLMDAAASHVSSTIIDLVERNTPSNERDSIRFPTHHSGRRRPFHPTILRSLHEVAQRVQRMRTAAEALTPLPDPDHLDRAISQSAP